MHAASHACTSDKIKILAHHCIYWRLMQATGHVVHEQCLKLVPHTYTWPCIWWLARPLTILQMHVMIMSLHAILELIIAHAYSNYILYSTCQHMHMHTQCMNAQWPGAHDTNIQQYSTVLESVAVADA